MSFASQRYLAEQIAAAEAITARIDQLMDEIKWNERRLANLVLSWEDQQQTMDLLSDLRAELHELTCARHAA